ncbi:MAG: DciA family protein [Steroidobacteraceae bacterium]
MPKIPQTHKRGGRTAVTKRGAPHAIGELLARGAPVLSQIRDQSARQTFWRSWLSEHLGEELDAHVTGAIERDGTLTLFATSAAWAARLRYTLSDLQPLVQKAEPRVHALVVRVLPRR